MNMFRTLRADEIDCRIAQIKEKDGKPAGLSLLLYKDARCDQNILDETVGPMCWERKHSRENANCTVSIWCEERGCWVSKEDTGTESNTEKEKGLASDSFKRACFNWGIGRELYTAPFIWITPDKCEFKKDSRGKWACYDRFTVHGIGYTDGVITGLEVKNQKTGKICYTYGKIIEKAADKPEQPDTEPDTVPEQPQGIQAAPVAASVSTVDRNHAPQAKAATVTTQREVPATAQKAAKPAEKPQEPKPEAKPEAKPETPATFIRRKIGEFKDRRSDFDFVAARQALIEGGVVEDIPSAIMTMEQAVQLMDAIDRNFLAEAS